MTSREPEVWRRERAEYSARVGPLAADRIRRAARGVKHPVYDFLFEYYPHPPSKLLAWSPGPDVVLLRAKPADTDWPHHFQPREGGAVLPAGNFPEKRRLQFARDLDHLRATAGREPFFGCFGLHEWAMLYRTPDRRHSACPLRISQSDLDATVESLGLRCSHFDAFRFFTRDAAPRNRVRLTRADAAEHDQPGCVHAVMDLYRYAYRLSPFVDGSLLASCFELAVRARELDMRASPYDLRALGYEPVAVETKDGRDLYARLQTELGREGKVVRGRLLQCYETLETQRPRSA